jgi:hypothetical protein
MTIERHYEPDAEALERVVEILYRLLLEPPAGSEHGDSPESAETGASCVVEVTE